MCSKDCVSAPLLVDVNKLLVLFHCECFNDVPKCGIYRTPPTNAAVKQNSTAILVLGLCG
jgi:hypothetical protein